MSRAFVKNDPPDEPLVVPRRAPLPSGVANYVTPRGLILLRRELAALEEDLQRAESEGGGEESKRSPHALALAQRIKELVGRIDSAQVVDMRAQPRDRVCFGSTVAVETSAGEERRLTIVGVDEADPSAGLVSFLAPIAKALLGLKVGDHVAFRSGKGEEELEVTDIWPATARARTDGEV